MTEMGKKILFGGLGVIILVGIAVFALYSAKPESSDYAEQTNADQSKIEASRLQNLRSFIDTMNEVSGIQSGAEFNYSLVDYGKPTNFSVQRCQNEVRCDVVAPSWPIAKFQQPNQPSPDNAEVDTMTNTIISVHRAVPEFAGGEYPAAEVERIARTFLDRVYPEFKTLEPKLTFEPGMKGARLNNGNYFFRWYDPQFKKNLQNGDQAEIDPFIQVGITAGGFIFGYDNTVEISQLVQP